jgi:putative intracellular protease/amidase
MTPFTDAARRFLDAGVPVAAACGATFGLAVAGLLDNRAHTSNAAEYLAASGYGGGDRFRDEPAVVDGALITASGVAPVHFARAILDRLGVYERACCSRGSSCTPTETRPVSSSSWRCECATNRIC